MNSSHRHDVAPASKQTPASSRGPSARALGLASTLAVTAIVGGLLLPLLPIPRVDLDLAACGAGGSVGVAVALGVWAAVCGGTACLLAWRPLRQLWAGGRLGLAAFLVVLAVGTYEATMNAYWIGSFAHDCGSPIPLLDPVLTFLVSLLAALVAGRTLKFAPLTAAVLGLAPVLGVMAAGYSFYSGSVVQAWESLGLAGIGVLAGTAFVLPLCGAGLLLHWRENREPRGPRQSKPQRR